MTTVVNLRKSEYDVYIGRKDAVFHFGNPFSIGISRVSSLIVGTREKAMQACFDWLNGDPRYADIEPLRRQWILDNLESLRGKSLGCFCKPQCCHGDIYRVFLGEISLEEALGQQHGRDAESEKQAPAKNHNTDDGGQMGLF